MSAVLPLSSWEAAQQHIFEIDGRVHPFDSSAKRRDALLEELEEAIRAEVFKRRGPDEDDDLSLSQVRWPPIWR
jgi:hypothetical protein